MLNEFRGCWVGRFLDNYYCVIKHGNASFQSSADIAKSSWGRFHRKCYLTTELVFEKWEFAWVWKRENAIPDRLGMYWAKASEGGDKRWGPKGKLETDFEEL